MADELATQADFLIVYIEEAHAVEEFAFSDNEYNLRKAKSLRDRIDAAKILQAHVESLDMKQRVPLLVDGMDDDAMFAYGARPERLYVFVDGVVAYQSNRGPYALDRADFEAKLRMLIA